MAFVTAGLVNIPLASAHHSPAAYDLQSQRTIEGTVAVYEWGNPHVYVSVREDARDGDARVWIVEAFASTAMKQFGWSPDTLKPGDRVAVVGNPARDPARSMLFLRSLRKANAVLFDVGAALAPAASAPSAIRASGLAGTWATVVGPAFFQFLGPMPQLPATPKGATAIGEFRDTTKPGVDCVPFTAPIYMILPGFRSIDVRDNVVLIRGEDADVERVIHLNLASHDSAAASIQGHSVGRFEDGVLVVETARFAPHRLGNGAGLPSGTEKHLVERYALNAAGGLTYSFELEDPEYLTESVSGASEWIYRPDVEFVATPCSAENARRFLAE